MPSFSLVTRAGTAQGLPYATRGVTHLLEAVVDLSVADPVTGLSRSLAQNQTADIIQLPPKCLVLNLGVEAITLATATAAFSIGDFGTTTPAASPTAYFSATAVLTSGATAGLITMSATAPRLYNTGGVIRVTQTVAVTATAGRFRVFATVIDLK